MDPIIIIGTGLAGYNTARALRKLDADIPLVMLTGDDGRAYSKPMLSNALAKGKDAVTLATGSAEDQARTLNAQIHTNCRVHSLSPEQHHLLTDKGEMRFQKLVLASGAQPIRLPIAGSGAEDVLSVNNLTDYGQFRKLLAGLPKRAKIALLGPGLIGCEFANDLLEADHEVTIIGPDRWPLSALLPEPVGRAVEQGLSEAGVQWRLTTTATRIEHDDEGYAVHLASGETLLVDLVLSAVGLRPDLSLAQAAGLNTNRGILVDRSLQTSAADIYAIGDCAELEGQVLPYVAPIMQAAPVLAQNLLGGSAIVTFPAMPVIIKTPACPIALSPPKGEGLWQFETDGLHVRALHHDAQGALTGFALTGRHVGERLSLTKTLPPLLA